MPFNKLKIKLAKKILQTQNKPPHILIITYQYPEFDKGKTIY